MLWYGNPLESKDGSDRIMLKLITEKRIWMGLKGFRTVASDRHWCNQQ
jgi:hypothetical protein